MLVFLHLQAGDFQVVIPGQREPHSFRKREIPRLGGGRNDQGSRGKDSKETNKIPAVHYDYS
jgi:hypothetical protein